jgi:hypothetical protein
MDITTEIELQSPLLLVETDKSGIKGKKGFFKVKVVNSAEGNKYKVGNILFVDTNFLAEFTLDEQPYENIYLLNETTVKGEINA